MLGLNVSLNIQPVDSRPATQTADPATGVASRNILINEIIHLCHICEKCPIS